METQRKGVGGVERVCYGVCEEEIVMQKYHSVHRAFVRLVPLALIGLPIACVVAMSAAVMQQDPDGLLPPPPAPTENPITEEKRILGKMLFWDEQLSSDGTMACATCHAFSAGGTDLREGRHPGPDGIPFTPDDRLGSPGVVHTDSNDEYAPVPFFGLRPQVTGRQAPPAVLGMFAVDTFWDGRARSEFVDPETGEVAIAEHGALESQSVGPPMDSVEMAHDNYNWPELRSRITGARPLALALDLPADVAAALAGDPTYPELFEAAFGDGAVTARRIAFAIGTYERTLVSDQAPLDLFLDGDNSAMTQQQQMGFNLFLGSDCSACHTFPLFTDQQFRNIGVRPVAEDIGRQEVTGNPLDAGKFKVPSLRNTGLHPRFMHNGMHASMEQVFDFYAHRNGQIPNDDNLDALFLEPIVFAPMQEDHVIDFLVNALTDPRVASEEFPFDRPALHTQQAANPENLGGGIPGSSGQVPFIIANRPPYLGNQWFQVGLDKALGDTQAWVAISADPPVGGEINADELLGPFVVGGVGVDGGYATGPYPIALDPSLDGTVFYMQWIVDDAGAPGGQAKSAVVRVTRFCGNGECVCPADFTRDGTINTQDVLAFLNAWSAGSLEADITRDGVVNRIDVIRFLGHWSDGC